MELSKILLLLGIISLSVPVAIVYTYGNLVTYIFSVAYSIHEENKYDIDPSWLLGVFLTSYSLGMFAIDIIKRRFGVMAALMTGMFLMVSGIVSTYFSIQHSAWATLLTYMLVGGIGDGMVVGTSILIMAVGFEDDVGLASSVPLASASMGGVALNQLLTRYINPDNLSPNGINGDIMYFRQPSIISRVPSVFLVIAGFTAACLSIGLAFILISLKRTKQLHKEDSETTEASGLYKSIETELWTLDKNKNPDHFSPAISSLLETSITTGVDSIVDPEISRNTKCPEHQVDDVKPIQALQSIEFYIIWMSYYSETFGNVVDANYYKLFGQTWIKDDNFLAFIGSWSSIVSCVFQIGCGYFIDRFGTKNALIGHLAISSFFMYLWYFTAVTSKWLFLVWSNVLQSVHNNLYVSFPVFVFKIFGQSHYTTNNGLMFTAMILGTLTSPPLSSIILSSYGWFWLFCSTGSLPFLSLIIVVFLMPPTPKR